MSDDASPWLSWVSGTAARFCDKIQRTGQTRVGQAGHWADKRWGRKTRYLQHCLFRENINTHWVPSNIKYTFFFVTRPMYISTLLNSKHWISVLSSFQLGSKPINTINILEICSQDAFTFCPQFYKLNFVSRPKMLQLIITDWLNH